MLEIKNEAGRPWTWPLISAVTVERMRITAAGNVDINSDRIRIRNNFTPTGTADSSGQVGDIAFDDNYMYRKTASGWRRVGTFSTF